MTTFCIYLSSLCFLLLLGRLETIVAFSLKPNMMEFSTLVKRKSMDCYFTDELQKDNILTLSYVPLSSRGGDIDEDLVEITMFDPNGRTFPLFKKDDWSRILGDSYIDPYEIGDYKARISDPGSYQVCIVNLDHKGDMQIYFRMVVSKPSDKKAEDDYDDLEGIPEEYIKQMQDYDISNEDLYKMKVTEIRQLLDIIWTSMNRISYYQSLTQAYYTQDFHIAEDNWSKINNYSIIVILTLLGVGVVQVFMVKGLFDDKSKIHRFIK